MAHPIMFDEADPFLHRVRELALAFPDAAEKISHGRPAFYTTKVFAYYGGAVKVAGGHQQHEQSVAVLLDPAEREALLQEERCFSPAYLGPYGWLGVDLDDQTDWDEIHELLEASYRRTAGQRRVARLDSRALGPADSPRGQETMRGTSWPGRRRATPEVDAGPPPAGGCGRAGGAGRPGPASDCQAG